MKSRYSILKENLEDRVKTKKEKVKTHKRLKTNQSLDKVLNLYWDEEAEWLEDWAQEDDI